MSTMVWQNEGSCYTQHVPTDLFFLDERDELNPDAIALCDQCPVRVQCLDYALKNRINDGIWGGTTGLDRRTSRFSLPRVLARLSKNRARVSGAVRAPRAQRSAKPLCPVCRKNDWVAPASSGVDWDCMICEVTWPREVE